MNGLTRNAYVPQLSTALADAATLTPHVPRILCTRNTQHWPSGSDEPQVQHRQELNQQVSELVSVGVWEYSNV